MDLEPRQRSNLAVGSGHDKGHHRDFAISTTLSRLGDFSIWYFAGSYTTRSGMWRHNDAASSLAVGEGNEEEQTVYYRILETSRWAPAIGQFFYSFSFSLQGTGCITPPIRKETMKRETWCTIS